MTTPSRSRAFLPVIIGVWLLIPVTNVIVGFFLDRSFYAYREWEFMTATDGPGPFKPDTVFRGTIYGDLAHMLHIREFRRYREQTFSTDSFGFRNPEFPPGAHFPIVVVGDSDMAGASLPDNATFSHLFGDQLNVPVYNYAPASILAFLADERFQKDPPEFVVWEAVERTITANTFQSYAAIPRRARFVRGKTDRQRPAPLPRLADFLAQDLYHEIVWRLGGHHEAAIGHIDQASGMLFYQPGIQILGQSARERGITEVVAGIDRINSILADRGITLLFLPLPDKEDIYQELIPDRAPPSDQHPFLAELQTLLRAKAIRAVDLFTPFRSAACTFTRARRDSDSLYFLDDTHWNEAGVALAVQETVTYLKAAGQLVGQVKEGGHRE